MALDVFSICARLGEPQQQFLAIAYLRPSLRCTIQELFKLPTISERIARLRCWHALSVAPLMLGATPTTTSGVGVRAPMYIPGPQGPHVRSQISVLAI